MSGSETEHARRVSRYGMVNAYLVREDDGLTVIDTAIGGSEKAILGAAAELGMPIRRIVLTHAHGDHVSSLDALAAELPDAEVSISAREARLLDKDMTMDPGEPEDKLRGGFPGTATKPTRQLAPGELVGSLEVVASPGHTPGHIALLDSRDGTLFCGDAFSTLGGTATCAKVNLLFPLPGLATWHKPTALESCRALRARKPRVLATGHGAIVENPVAAMDAAIAKAARSLS